MATVNHKEHKLSFQNAPCVRDPIANGQIPSLCPIFVDLSERHWLSSPDFSGIPLLFLWESGGEILMLFLRWVAACALTPGRSQFSVEINCIHIVMFAWCKKCQKEWSRIRVWSWGTRWAPRGSSSNTLKASLYVWLPWCVEKAE